MDWCWQLNPSSFVSILVEILECDNDLPKDKFVSWIVGALCAEDMVQVVIYTFINYESSTALSIVSEYLKFYFILLLFAKLNAITVMETGRL